jgi:hypothetical protein
MKEWQVIQGEKYILECSMLCDNIMSITRSSSFVVTSFLKTKQPIGIIISHLCMSDTMAFLYQRIALKMQGHVDI